MNENDVSVTWTDSSLALPRDVNPEEPYVAVAYDEAGNTGLPRLFYAGKTTPVPKKDPMDFLNRDEHPK